MKLLQRYPWLIDPTDEREWVPVEATPIVEATYRELFNAKDPWNTLPVVAPWRYTALEFTVPHGARARFFVRVFHNTSRDMVNYVADYLRDQPVKGPTSDKEPVQSLICEYFQSVARGMPLEVGRVDTLLDNDGLLVKNGIAPKPGLVTPGGDEETAAKWLHFVHVMGISVFAFLNCKNVTVADEPPPPPAVAKKRRKRGVPEVVYKQLIVDGRPITRGPGRDDPEAADFRYHICRGHFADYRDKGLFGDPERRGIYWKPMHVKGSKANGEVVKDYSVRP